MRDNKTSSRRLLRLLQFYATLVCLLILGQSARGQQEPGDVVRISTELVETPVAVFDRQGRFVDNLRAEQFELRADGKVVPISFFERVGERRQAAADSVPATRGRRIVFFVDDLHLSADSVEHVRKSLLRFLDAEMGENDQVAVASASGQVGFLQQFTDNKAVLRAAVGRIKYRTGGVQDTMSPVMSEYVALKIAQGDRGALNFYTNEMLRSLQFDYALPKYGGKGPGYKAGSESDQAERMVAQRAQSIVARSGGATLAALSALENFLRSSAQAPGREHVLFISDGFFMQGGENFAQKLQRVTDAAARAGGVVYTLDARALASRAGASFTRLDTAGRPDKYSEGEAEASAGALALLAETTGGRSLGTEDLGAGVGHAVAETFNYYLLAWRPETEAQRVERFRQIQVSVAGRPDLTVRLPRGFLEAESNAPKKSAQSAPADLHAASATTTTPAPARSQELPTRLALEYLNTPDNRMMLTASTQVDADALAYGEGGTEAAAVDLAGVIMDEQGNRAGSFGTRLNVEPLAQETARGASHVVIYNYRAPLKPGLYQVRVAARDGRTGRAGRAAEWLEIPDLAPGRLTLSSLFLGLQEIAAGAKAGPDAPRMQFSVDHRFRRDGALNFFLFVYNAPAAGGSVATLAVDVRVIRDRQVRLTVPPQKVAPEAAAADPRRVPFGGSFPLRSLAPGPYLLRVTVTDSRTRASASQDAKFVVE